MGDEVKMQYDAYIGGGINLPVDVNIFKFAAARAKEIAFMRESIENPKSTKLIFQKLPAHMRRRVMSHHAKRLPRQLRESHLSQLSKAGMPPTQKRPSRKYRRRPANLQCEYIRRQRSITWLETHIWHAKRFHMVQRWGYKLPERPCDKAFRALYRASSKHCLLQDVSYINCIEICGDVNYLLEMFKIITNPALGLSLGAKANISGYREGRNVFYYPNKYPKQPIGEITYMWKLPSETHRTIWIWAHAAFYSELVNMLISLFNLELYNETEIQSNDSRLACPTYMSKSENMCQLRVLKHDLNRYRLTGPLSQAVLKRSLTLADESNILPSNWFRKELRNTDIYDQHKFWNALKVTSPSELPAHLIIGLTVTDPRVNTPAKRTKAILEDETSFIPSIKNKLALSSIWNSETRIASIADKPTNSALCASNSQQLVPGVENSLSKQLACMPILLVQRPGNQSNYLGYGSGYDIITPNGWGLPLWFTMVMWGARVGGLRENRVSVLENQRGPILAPDTTAGKTDSIRKQDNLTARYFRRPPNKRVNYVKIAIVSPFQCNWSLLVQEWQNTTDGEYYVLRDKLQLQMLSNKIKGEQLLNANLDMTQPAIIPVILRLKSRGLVKDNAIICLPTDSDILEKSSPVEPRHEDPHQSERKRLQTTHLKYLKTLKRKRLNCRKQLQQERLEESDSTIPIAKHAEKMRSLWLPDVTIIRKSCSREVIGFISHGDFSFCQAKPCAVGFICIQAFDYIREKTVLVRDTNSRQYRFATFDVIS